MKCKTINNKYNIIESYLFKYQNNITPIFPKKTKVILHLKQSLKIIYNFHHLKKKIWFVGFSDFSLPLVNNLTEHSNHLFLSKVNWVKGLIGNKKFVKSKFKNTQHPGKNHVFKQPDLLVIFNLDFKTSETLKEFYKLDTPTVIFGAENFSIPSFNILSFVPIKTKEKKIGSLILFLLHSILKKSK